MMSMDINNVHGHCGQQKMSMDKCPQDQQDPKNDPGLAAKS
jgi:hypothetical protein